MGTLLDLRTRLREAKVSAAGQPQREFLPDGYLEELLPFEAVRAAIADSAFGVPEHKRESTANIVISEGRKVFAILTDLKLEHALGSFIENECLDPALPLSESTLKEVIPHDAREFVKRQWDYLAYRFRKGFYHRKVQKEQILPYLEQTQIGGGGYSKVYKVLIHPAHQNLVPSAPRTGLSLVRKEIKVLRPGSKHEDEAELLFLLGSLRHKHIVELLASYTQAGIPNLLFMPADSDLHDFLLLQNRPGGFEENTTIFRALHGLSSGLAYLYNFRPRPQRPGDPSIPSMHGYHHDIKPRNILVRGTDFILADFGLSSLKDVAEDTKTIWKDTTFEYGPPECRNPDTFLPGNVGRALDIWSLGCIFSEVMVYMESGSDGILEFRKQRLIDNVYGITRCFHDNTALNPAVNRYLNQIEEKSSCPSTHSLSSLILTMFATRTEDRPTAEEVEGGLVNVTLEAFVHALLQTIDRCFDVSSDSTDNNVFQTQLNLERTRLEAWAVVLGLKPIYGHRRTFENQVITFFPELCNTLQSTIQGLENRPNFDSGQDDHDFIISAVHHTNNSICSHLSDALKAAVDSTFAVLGTRATEPESLLHIETATLGEYSQQYEDIGAVAAMKYMAILLDRQPTGSAAGSRIEMSLIQKDPKSSDPQIRPQTYWYSYGYQHCEKRKVIIEWKGYDMRWAKDPRSNEFREAGEKVFGQIQELVGMLERKPKPANFRVLNCLGAFHDIRHHQFGIVYAFPVDRTVPVRLQSLLRRQRSQKVFPDPGQRLALAKALVGSVHSFHISGWLHKNLNSYNILFFHTSDEDFTDLDLGKPYIVGFNHSRRDSPYAYSEGPVKTELHEYQHPAYRGGSSKFQKYFDQYSLGLVLLEIGTWNSLSNISDLYPTYSPAALKPKYIECCDNQLRMSMGPTYCEATRKCLQSDIRFDKEDVGSCLNFQEEVVNKLRSCSF